MSRTSISTRYLVYRTDEHGTKYLMHSGILSLREAHAYVKRVLSQQTKAHHQKYDVMSYDLGRLNECLRAHGILR